MKLTVLGSGGCTVIPRPCCQCPVCRQAREKGPPYARTGPSAFLHDIHALIDAPAEVALQLNRAAISRLDYLLLTHLDPDHVEGLRVVEHLALDFRTWCACPEKQVRLLLPEPLVAPLRGLRSQYGSVLDFYRERGFVSLVAFDGATAIGDMTIAALPVDRGAQVAFVYVFSRAGRRVVYAPCDIKPFPEDRPEAMDADLLVIQPGVFEEGLKHGFRYPPNHVSRRTLYTFEETLTLARRLRARRVVFTHLEEYWNRGYDEYLALEPAGGWFRFAWDGMGLVV